MPMRRKACIDWLCGIFRHGDGAVRPPETETALLQIQHPIKPRPAPPLQSPKTKFQSDTDA